MSDKNISSSDKFPVLRSASFSDVSIRKVLGAGKKGSRKVALPYRFDALEPYLSSKGIRQHFFSHHISVVNELHDMIAGTSYQGLGFGAIARSSAVDGNSVVQALACQAHSHEIYWKNMSPKGGGRPSGRLLEMIERDFGSFEKFRSLFRGRAANRLWVGWLWLVETNGKLELMHGMGVESPVVYGGRILLALDLWELAYHADYGDNRDAYVQKFLNHLVDWSYIASRMTT